MVDIGKNFNLSPREQQIATLVSEGLTNRQIADELNLSHYTVRNQLGFMFNKMNLKNRVQIASWIAREAA